jgi:hypothetical protein
MLGRLVLRVGPAVVEPLVVRLVVQEQQGRAMAADAEANSVLAAAATLVSACKQLVEPVCEAMVVKVSCCPPLEILRPSPRSVE